MSSAFISPRSPCPAASDLLEFIDVCPTPWHVSQRLMSLFQEAGFTLLDESLPWVLVPGEAYCVVRYGAPLAAFRYPGVEALRAGGLRLLAAHIDSPGLRIKPDGLRADLGGVGRLGVEVYGGPVLATFADRDLSLAGRVIVRAAEGGEGAGLVSHLVRFDEPLLRIPNAAIHINRDVNEKGLLLHKHSQLVPLMPLDSATRPEEALRSRLGAQLKLSSDEILEYDLCVYDTQKPAFCGAGNEWISASRIDNLASCHAIFSALTSVEVSTTLPLALFFDHEEVGSVSAEGAAGNFAISVIDRICSAAGFEPHYRHSLVARSLLLSVDMAHAYHPGYAASYDTDHPVHLNGGPVIKYNAGQRYTTDAETAAFFASCCQAESIPCQRLVNRADVPCGSTVGPVLSAHLGMRAADVGNPMWAMHSIRETAGSLDHAMMIRALKRFLVMQE